MAKFDDASYDVKENLTYVIEKLDGLRKRYVNLDNPIERNNIVKLNNALKKKMLVNRQDLDSALEKLDSIHNELMYISSMSEDETQTDFLKEELLEKQRAHTIQIKKAIYDLRVSTEKEIENSSAVFEQTMKNTVVNNSNKIKYILWVTTINALATIGLIIYLVTSL